MRVLVVGANGQIGKQIVSKLARDTSHSVTAMVRKEEQAQQLKEKGIDVVIADLESSVEQLVTAMDDAKAEAIIFTAGSGGKTGNDKTLLIDLDGAAKTIEAATSVGIERFIMISAHQAHHRENWNEKIKPYYVAKHYADKILVSSDLNYTIIRPGGLLNEPGTGKISAAENLTRGNIPREDVATTAIETLTQSNTFKKSFDLTSGEIAITDALTSID